MISERLFVLMLCRSLGPFALTHDVTEIVQLGCEDWVAKLYDCAARATQPHHPAVGRVRSARIEAGRADVPPYRFEILARWIMYAGP